MSETVYQNMPDHEIMRAILAEYPFVSESREDAPGVWTHTFTPPNMAMEDVAATLNAVRVQTSNLGTLLISQETMRQIRKVQAQARRDHRMQLRKSRQRRTQQRRHERGGRA